MSCCVGGGVRGAGWVFPGSRRNCGDGGLCEYGSVSDRMW